MKNISAVVHSTGVVLRNGLYVPLEFAYVDCTGCERSFRVASPLTYRECKRIGVVLEPDAVVSKHCGVPLSEIGAFLRERYESLRANSDAVVFFGYKGIEHQAPILIGAGIPNVVDLKTLGFAPLPMLAKQFSRVEKLNCKNHVRPDTDKCALHAARLLFLRLGNVVQQYLV